MDRMPVEQSFRAGLGGLGTWLGETGRIGEAPELNAGGGRLYGVDRTVASSRFANSMGRAVPLRTWL